MEKEFVEKQHIYQNEGEISQLLVCDCIEKHE